MERTCGSAKETDPETIKEVARLSPEQTRSAEIARELLASFTGAWNRGDMAALARAFHEDAGFVDVRGNYVRGNEAIGRQHEAERAGALKESVLRGEVVDARQPAPGVIVGHMRTEMDVAGRTRAAFLTFALEQRDGKWRFSEVHHAILPSPSS